MAFTLPLIGDLADLGLNDFQIGPGNARKIRGYVRTNLGAGDALIDTTNQVTLLGDTPVTILSNGTWSVDLLDTSSTDLNVEANTLQYELVVEYTSTGSPAKRVYRSGWFALTEADLELVDDVPMAVFSSLDLDLPSVTPSWRSAFAAEMEAIRDETAVISGLTGEDAAVALLIDTPASDTATALSATTVTVGEANVNVAGYDSDPSTALTLALADNPSGARRFHLPAGLYRGSFDLSANLELWGAGPGRTVLKHNDIPAQQHVIGTSWNYSAAEPTPGVAIRNLTVDGNKAAHTGNRLKTGISLHQCPGFILDGIEVKDVDGTGILINGNGTVTRGGYIGAVESHNNDAHGIWQTAAARRIKVAGYYGHNNGLTGYHMDASEVEIIRAQCDENGHIGFLFNNAFDTNIAGISASLNGREGIWVVGMMASTGTGWTSHNNGYNRVPTFTGATTNGSTTITATTPVFRKSMEYKAAGNEGASEVSFWGHTDPYPGNPISGSGIPVGAYIVTVISPTEAVISAAATATASGVSLAMLADHADIHFSDYAGLSYGASDDTVIVGVSAGPVGSDKPYSNTGGEYAAPLPTRETYGVRVKSGNKGLKLLGWNVSSGNTGDWDVPTFDANSQLAILDMPDSSRNVRVLRGDLVLSSGRMRNTAESGFPALSKPAIAGLGGLGTSPPTPTLSEATDVRGVVQFGTGTTPGAPAGLGTVTFNRPYAVQPRVTLHPLNNDSAAIRVWASPTVNGFTINTIDALAASKGVGFYQWGYTVTS